METGLDSRLSEAFRRATVSSGPALSLPALSGESDRLDAGRRRTSAWDGAALPTLLVPERMWVTRSEDSIKTDGEFPDGRDGVSPHRLTSHWRLPTTWTHQQDLYGVREQGGTSPHLPSPPLTPSCPAHPAALQPPVSPSQLGPVRRETGQGPAVALAGYSPGVECSTWGSDPSWEPGAGNTDGKTREPGQAAPHWAVWDTAAGRGLNAA